MSGTSTSKKNTTKKNPSRDLWLWAELAVFVAIGALLATTWYKYQINPDGTSYISIAEKYAHFQLRHAINGYWGPLFSILLVPFLWLHVPPIIAAKLLNVLAGALILWLFYYLATREVKADKKIAHLLVLGLAPSLYVWIMPGPITPDVLMVAILLAEIIALLEFLRKPAARQQVWLLGLAGLALYVTKDIGFYIFIVQLSAVLLVLAWAQKKYKFWFRAWLKALVVFLILASPVIAALSLKYHYLAVSTAGNYNHGILAPQYNMQVVHPMTVSGPFAPPNNTAYSVWEDPSHLPVPQWKILGSMTNLKYFIRLIYHNLNLARDAIASFGAVVAVGFVALTAYLLLGLPRGNRLPLVFGLTALATIAGYLSLSTEPRYILIVVPLSLLAIAMFCRDFTVHGTLLYLTGTIFVLVNFWIAAQALNASRNVGTDIHAQAIGIARYIPPHSKVTSDTFGSIYTCMYDGLQCYGLITPSGNPTTDKGLYNELRRDGVRYYVNFGSATPADINFVAQHAGRPVTVSPAVTVYEFK